MSQYTNLSSGDALWVQRNIHDLKELPEPGKTWRLREADISAGALHTLRDKDLLDREPRKKGSKTYRYRTPATLYEAVQTFIKQSERSDGILPCKEDGCPASGFRTVSAGIKCKRCGTVHDRDEVTA